MDLDVKMLVLILNTPRFQPRRTRDVNILRATMLALKARFKGIQGRVQRCQQRQLPAKNTANAPTLTAMKINMPRPAIKYVNQHIHIVNMRNKSYYARTLSEHSINVNLKIGRKDEHGNAFNSSSHLSRFPFWYRDLSGS